MGIDINFRTFVELTEKMPSFFDSLQDELGIRPEDFEKTAQVGSFMNFGKDTYNMSSYRILGYQYDVQGKPVYAKIELTSQPNATTKHWQNRDDKQVRMPNSEQDTKTYLIPIDKLKDLLSQGMNQQQQQQAGGGLGGGAI